MELINHPKHYNETGIEVIEIIESYKLSFSLGNAIKYLLRCSLKHEEYSIDVKKAIWYLKRTLNNRTYNTEMPKDCIPVRMALFGRTLPAFVENSLYTILQGLATDRPEVYESVVIDSLSTAIFELENARY